jgi:uncharacterized cupin superfamily protein
MRLRERDMPKIDIGSVPLRTGTIYPPPYDQEVQGRSSLRLGDAGGLTQFGANLVILEPGAKASMRHWHEVEDEFLIVTEGELTLVEETGETLMRPGDCAAFKAGVANGHRMVNNSDREGRFLVIGSRGLGPETCHYPDTGLTVVLDGAKVEFSHASGKPLKSNG